MLLEPDKVTLQSDSDMVKVKATIGGKPVPSAQMNLKVQDGKAWMFQVAKSATQPGVITIRPSANPKQQPEDGSYTLAVSTSGETEYVVIIVKRDSHTSEGAGISLPAHLNVPKTCEEGTLFTQTLSGPPDVKYTWLVNGETVLSGVGKDTLEYTLSKPGVNTVCARVERGDQVVGEVTGSTSVTPVKAQPYPAYVGVQFTLDTLKEGFREYEWLIDGVSVSKERVLKHTFDAQGRHKIEGFARNPLVAEAGKHAYLHVAYDTTVNTY